MKDRPQALVHSEGPVEMIGCPPIPLPGPPDAAQTQRRSPSPHPEDVVQSALQVYGAGQWLETSHGAKSRRKWRKLHLAINATSGVIVAQTLTDQDADDPSQWLRCFDQIDGRIARVTADGAYVGAPTHQTIVEHGDGIEVVIPLRATAVPTGEPGSYTQRDRQLDIITERGRLAWQAATN